MWNIQDHVNIIRGRHNLRFGGSIQPSRRVEQFNQYPSGQLVFDQRGSAQPNIPDTGNGVASMLLGQVASSNHFDQIPYDQRTWFTSAFVQDDFKFSHHLTINVGLRWEHDVPWWDATFGQNFFNPTPINPVSGTPGVIEFARNIYGYQNVGRPVHEYTSQWTLFQPRTGFAWSPAGHEQWVIRGGWGIFDLGQDAGTTEWQTPEAGNTPNNQQLTTDSLGLVTPFILSQGFPGYVTPPLNASWGAVPVGQSPTTNPYFFFNGKYPGQKMGVAMTHQWNVTVARQVGHSMKVELGYVGSHTANFPQGGTATDFNAIPLDKLGPGPDAQTLRPYPQFGDLLGWGDTYGRANYNAFYSQLTRSWSSGLTFTTSFTHSKNLETSYYRGLYFRNVDYGPAPMDIPKWFVFSGAYDLPIGPGKRYLGSNSWIGILVGGWRIGGTYSAQSGPPLNFSPFADTSNDLCSCSQGVNLTGAVTYNKSGFDPNVKTWFNTAPFALAAPYTFGTAGIGIARGAGVNNLDSSISKEFRIRERYAFELRSDFFNMFNHPNWASPNITVGSPSFGYVTGTQNPNGNRIIQVSARFSF
jgi:hypothetical protein